MFHTRSERENLERQTLAPYAVRSAESAGRQHREQPHPIRSEFQRDRDRIVHSRAFRRLEYKTQVFVNGTADHYRTRLTHTIEMAYVAQTLARALRVNEDLAEAISLAHDIGHSPFGHSGEHALNELMREHGGFDHNEQSLRWVECLEQRYPGFDGLNLSWEVRAGLRKHTSAADGAALDGHPLGPFQQLEAQIADVADDMTYHAHDVDDGLDAGLLTESSLNEHALWRQAVERVRAEFGDVPEASRRSIAVRCLLDLQVQDVLDHSCRLLETYRPETPQDVMQAPERLVTFSPALREQLEPFRAFLFEKVYWHPDVAGANQDAVRLMRSLFSYYAEHPEHMGSKARARLERDGLMRTACDYVSGMTDRYAIEECRRFGLDRPAAGPGGGLF